MSALPIPDNAPEVIVAAAPTEIGLDVAAVMVPSTSKAGSRDLIFSISGLRGPSSIFMLLPY